MSHLILLISHQNLNNALSLNLYSPRQDNRKYHLKPENYELKGILPRPLPSK